MLVHGQPACAYVHVCMHENLSSCVGSYSFMVSGIHIDYHDYKLELMQVGGHRENKQRWYAVMHQPYVGSGEDRCTIHPGTMYACKIACYIQYCILRTIYIFEVYTGSVHLKYKTVYISHNQRSSVFTCSQPGFGCAQSDYRQVYCLAVQLKL